MPSDMEISENSYTDNPQMRSRILIVCDATKDRIDHEFRHTIRRIRMRGGILHPGDRIKVFGVLHRVLHPSKSCFFLCSSDFLSNLAISSSLFCDGWKLEFVLCSCVVMSDFLKCLFETRHAV